MRARTYGWGVCVAMSLCGCGYSSLQQQDEDVKTSWSEVVSQYQRRADLVSGLVDSVKDFAAAQQELIGATEASARSSSQPVAPALLNDSAAFQSYQQLQDRLTQSLRALMGVSEANAELRSDANFRDLRAQLADTQARLEDARARYAEAVRAFNTSLSTFPTDLTARVFDFHPKPDLPATSTARP